MKRYAESSLSEWRDRPSRKPLVLRGARQVGKTYLVEHWGAEHFDSVVTVDLERERDLHSLFSQSDPTRVLAELGVLRGRSVTPGKTLLFLDEIQACPPALALLRYFHELMPELHVIAAGSLLDFALREFEYSMPVGRIEFLHLQPMSFEEFVAATEGEALVDYLKTWSLAQPPSEAVAKRFLEAVRRYFFVGGMPEAVGAYAERKDLLEVQRIQTALVETVQADFGKYGPRRLQELMRKTYMPNHYTPTKIVQLQTRNGIKTPFGTGKVGALLNRIALPADCRKGKRACCGRRNKLHRAGRKHIDGARVGAGDAARVGCHVVQRVGPCCISFDIAADGHRDGSSASVVCAGARIGKHAVQGHVGGSQAVERDDWREGVDDRQNGRLAGRAADEIAHHHRITPAGIRQRHIGESQR